HNRRAVVLSRARGVADGDLPLRPQHRAGERSRWRPAPSTTPHEAIASALVHQGSGATRSPRPAVSRQPGPGRDRPAARRRALRRTPQVDLPAPGPGVVDRRDSARAQGGVNGRERESGNAAIEFVFLALMILLPIVYFGTAAAAIQPSHVRLAQAAP